MAIRVRPCRALLEHATPLLVVGAITRDTYVIEALGARFPLPTEAVERDDRGDVALLTEGDYVFGDVTVHVGPFYEEGMPPGGEILLRVGAEPAPRVHSSEDIIVSVDPRPSYLLTFDGDGGLDGWG